MGVSGKSLMVALLAVALGGCNGFDDGPAATRLDGEQVDLPSLKRDGFLYVEATINGRGPYRLLLDTGSPGLLVTSRVAQEAGLSPSQTALLPTPVGTFREMLAGVDHLDIGGLHLARVRAYVVAPEHTALLGRDFEGIAGMAVFRDVVLGLDFPAGRVWALTRVPKAFASLKQASYRGLRPEIAVTVAGRPGRAVLNTGNSFAWSVPGMDELPLAAPITLDEGGGEATLGSAVYDRGRNSQLNGEARWGPVTWRDPPLRWQAGSEVGTVGAAALQQLSVAIDPQAKRIYFLDGEITVGWPLPLR